MHFIKHNELTTLLNFEEILAQTKKAFKLYSAGKTITPPFTVFTIPESNGSVHFKSGYVPGNKYFAMKYSGAFYGNEKLGLSNFLGLFIVFNATTGAVEAIIDDKGLLTDYRTGVAGAIATSTLSNPNSKTVAMIGTGLQARMQLSCLLKIMPITNLNIWGRTPSKVNEFAKEMKSLHPDLTIKICDTPKDAVSSADIVYTVTYSESPIIKAAWIKPGTHITAVGACEPSMQELDENLFKKANIICADSKEATSQNGEIHHAIKNSIISTENITELGDILTKNIKRKPTDITICDLVGIGFQDAVIANCVMTEYTNKNIIQSEN